jgi:hypothetical protein
VDDAVRHELMALERALMQPAVRASRERLDALLCDDFREIVATGRTFGKDDVLQRLPGKAGVGFGATQFEVRAIAPGVALIVYRATRQERGVTAHSLRSSLWRCEAGRWRMAFHQGTPLPAADNISAPQDSAVPPLPA